jgi:hypothetical protein
VDADLDTLVTAPYVKVDDALQAAPQPRRWRPPVGIAPKLTDAELLTLAVLQALGRCLGGPLVAVCPHPPARVVSLPARPVRLQPAAAGGVPAAQVLHPGAGHRYRPVGRHRVGGPLHPGGVRPLPPDGQALGLAGWAAYGWCASHSRWFWGLRLHLVWTLHGLPVAFALANPETDERGVLVELLDVQPGLLAERPGLVIGADKGYRDAQTEAILAAQGVRVLRPACQGRRHGPASGCWGRCGS